MSSRWVQTRACCVLPPETISWTFESVDVAAVPRLLAELDRRHGFRRTDAIETVIDLLDQVYTLRHQLEQLGQAIGCQPAETREAIRGGR